MEQTKSTFTKFSPDFIKQTINDLIPDGFAQKRISEGTFQIETFFKKGLLTKFQIDNQDLSSKINQKTTQKIESILKMAGKLRFKFTGKVQFIITRRQGLTNLYRMESNFILKEI
jgi:hypothetical protein